MLFYLLGDLSIFTSINRIKCQFTLKILTFHFRIATVCKCHSFNQHYHLCLETTRYINFCLFSTSPCAVKWLGKCCFCTLPDNLVTVPVIIYPWKVMPFVYAANMISYWSDFVWLYPVLLSWISRILLCHSFNSLHAG